MKRYAAIESAFYLISILVLFLMFPVPSMAYLILDASLKGVYEDNVNSAFSGANRPRGSSPGMMTVAVMPKGMGSAGTTGTGSTGTGDFYAVLAASAGVASGIGDSAELFIKAEASHYQFNSFTDLNSTSIGASTGMFMKLSDLLLTQVVLYGRATDYGDSERNSKTYGGNVIVKQRFSPEFWLKEQVGYERNDANTDTFSYKGPFIGVSAGVRIAPKTTAILGYLFADRKFDDGAESKSNAFTAGVDHELTKQFNVFASYEHMAFTGAPPGASDTDNLYTVGIGYSY